MSYQPKRIGHKGGIPSESTANKTNTHLRNSSHGGAQHAFGTRASLKTTGGTNYRNSSGVYKTI